VTVGAPPPVVTIGHHVLFIIGSPRFKLNNPETEPIDLIYLITEFANPVVVVSVVYFQSICAGKTRSRVMDDAVGIVNDYVVGLQWNDHSSGSKMFIQP
jgi:hypothetical protein